MMKMIECDHVDGDAVEGAAVCASIEEVPLHHMKRRHETPLANQKYH